MASKAKQPIITFKDYDEDTCVGTVYEFVYYDFL